MASQKAERDNDVGEKCPKEKVDGDIETIFLEGRWHEREIKVFYRG